MKRFLYSAAAIVVAFFVKAEAPLGEGLSDAQAYKRQGMYQCSTSWPGGGYRWRSLERWARLSEQWWPERAVLSITALVSDFVSRARAPNQSEAVVAALRSHSQWGDAM